FFSSRRRHTRFSRDWSSDVCSSDLSAQTVSLADYVGRMKEGQDKIYYLTADSHAAAAHSPHLEVFRRKGLEVLLLSDRVDEWMRSEERRVGKGVTDGSRGISEMTTQ